MIGRTWQTEVFSGTSIRHRLGLWKRPLERCVPKRLPELPGGLWTRNYLSFVQLILGFDFEMLMLWDVVRCCDVIVMYFIFCLEFWKLKFHIEQTSRMDLQPSSRGENPSMLNWEGSHDTDAAWDVPNMKNTSNWTSTYATTACWGASQTLCFDNFWCIIHSQPHHCRVPRFHMRNDFSRNGGAAEVVPKCTVEW